MSETAGFDETIEASDKLIDGIILVDESLDGVPKKKRKIGNEVEVEKKRIAEDEYNRQVHEQRYKLLMHLLNKSKFYSEFIIKKIETPPNKRHQHKVSPPTNNENVSPQNEKLRKARPGRAYDIRKYIPSNVEKKIHDKKRLNLSEEDIEHELANGSDTETNKNPDTVEIPKYFNGTLYDYQKKGLQWLKVLYENGLNGILADEMGLGKTIQVIALVCHLIEKRQAGPFLILAPLSTLPNWAIEFERFAPKIPFVVYHGTGDVRLNLYKNIKKMYPITNTYKTQPVVITSYDVGLRDQSFLKTQNWRYIVVDEGQRIKNHESLLMKALKTFKSMNRLILTGTPLQNNLAELWSLLHFLLPEIFDDLAVFEAWFDAKEIQEANGTERFLQQEKEKHVISSLREILRPFMLRREKSDVNLQLPGKKELVVYAPVTKLQHDLYKAILNYDLSKLSKISETPEIIEYENGQRPKRRCALRALSGNYYGDLDRSNREMSPNVSSESNDSIDSHNWKQITPGDRDKMNIWNQYTDVTERNLDFLIRIRLGNRISMYRKVVNHPYLIHCPLGSDGLPKVDEDLVKASGKLLVLDAMLAKLKSRGHKVLLFSTMTTLLDMIEDYLSLRDYKYLRLDGRTDLDVRSSDIKKFNSNPDIFLYLISTRAGGVGLNLVAADTVIIYDSDWNPQVDIQAMARAHRIGQTRPVVIYRLCTKGTVDERIIGRGHAKRALEKMVIGHKSTVNLTDKNTLLELKEMLEKKDYQIVTSKNKVFTEEELDALLDRSDIQSGETSVT